MLCQRLTLHCVVSASNSARCWVSVKHCTVLCQRLTLHRVVSASNTAPCCFSVQHCTVLCQRLTLHGVESVSNTALCCVSVKHCTVLCQRQTLHRDVWASNTALSVYSNRTPCCDKSHDSLLLHFFRNFEENFINILLSVYLLHKTAVPKCLVFGQLVKNSHPSLNQKVHCGAEVCQWNSYGLSHIHTIHAIKYCSLMTCCNTTLLFWLWSSRGSPTSCLQIKVLDYFCITSCGQYTIYPDKGYYFGHGKAWTPSAQLIDIIIIWKATSFERRCSSSDHQTQK